MRGSDKQYKPIRWEFDLYANKFIPRYEALPAPVVGIFDAPVACAMINLQWLSHVLGVLEVLTQRDSWTGDDNEIYRVQQEIEKLINSLNQACGDDTMLYRQDGCILEISQDGGATWQPVFDSSVCAIPGPPGADGTPGAPGADGQDCDCVPANPPTPPQDPVDNAAEICGIANYLIDLMFELSDDSADQLEQGIAPFAIASAFASLDPTGITEAILSFTEGVLSLGILQYRAEFTVQAIEDMKCDLYCVIRENGGSFSSPATWEAWKTKHRERGFNLNWELFYTTTAVRTDSWWNQRAALGLRAPSVICEICQCFDVWSWSYAATTCTYNLPDGWSLDIITGACGDGSGGFDGLYTYTGAAGAAVLQFTITPVAGQTVSSIVLDATGNFSAFTTRTIQVQQGAFNDARPLGQGFTPYTFNTNESGVITVTLTHSGGSFNGVGVNAIEIEYS